MPIQLPLEQAVPIDRLLPYSASRSVRSGSSPASSAKTNPVEPDEPDPDPFHVAVGPPSTPPRWRSRRSAPTNVSWSVSTIAGRAMMRTSQPGWNEGAIALSTSRSRRRTRFRTTAPPSFRPVDNPNRVVSRSVRRNRAEKSGWDRTGPGALERREILRTGEHHESRRMCCRGRSSGRQPLPTASPSGGDHATAAGGSHPGAKSVLLRAMALLGLVGLLRHRGCARSSPFGLGSTIRPLEEPQTRLAPVSASARSSSGG